VELRSFRPPNAVRVDDTLFDLAHLLFVAPVTTKSLVFSAFHGVAQFCSRVAGPKTVVVRLQSKSRVHDNVGMLTKAVDDSEALGRVL